MSVFLAQLDLSVCTRPSDPRELDALVEFT